MSSGSLVPSTSNTGLSKRSDTIFDASSRRWKTVVRGVYSPCVNTLLSHDVQCGSQICISLSLTNVDTNTMTEQTKYRSLSCISVTLFYCSQLACHMTNKNSPLCLSHDKQNFILLPSIVGIYSLWDTDRRPSMHETKTNSYTWFGKVRLG